LRSFQERLPEFERRGAEVLAISVDSRDESRKLCQSRGYTFPFLSDPNTTAIRAYGVLHPHGGEDGQDIARPAEFLVDASGTIQWENLTESVLSRLHPQTALRVLDGMPAPSR
jgi:peroxiredoxin Q/BCP